MNNKLTLGLLYSALEEDALQHHGILGMKWGKRHGPPYPLDKTVSKKIKRKGKNKLAIKKRKYKEFKVGALPKNYSVIEMNKNVNGSLNYFGGLSGDAHLAPMNVAEYIGSGHGEAIRTLNRPGHKIIMEDLKSVNVSGSETYETTPNRRQNCALCSSALALRSLGYNVVSGDVAPKVSGTMTGYGEQWFDGAVRYKENGAANAYRRMVSLGNQGKGFFDFRYKVGGGHSVYFQNERGSDGKVRPVIYDGQVGQRYEKFSDFLKEYGPDLSRFANITRINGSTPNWDALEKDRVVQVDRATVPKVTSRKLSETGQTVYRLDDYYTSSGNSIVGDMETIKSALKRYSSGDKSIVADF